MSDFLVNEFGIDNADLEHLAEELDVTVETLRRTAEIVHGRMTENAHYAALNTLRSAALPS